MRNISFRNISFIVLAVFCSERALAQSTEFKYQGRLFDGGIAAMGNYDFEFRLFAVENGGSPLAAQQRPAITVSNGVFTVSLDFGVLFTGEARFLEIALKPVGSPDPFTVLSPRHRITSAPYAIKSLAADAATDSAQLGGMAADQYVLTGDPRLSDARDPLPGSSDYIQNTNSPQAASNFNISGDGTAGGTLSGNIVNTITQYNIGGNRVLSVAGSGNLFAGGRAGESNITGFSNSFFGSSAGRFNTTGGANSFFGTAAGTANTTGFQNSFFGIFAGNVNTTGTSNSFFGRLAGLANTTGSNNTMVGADTDVGANNLTFATAIGSGTVASLSNSIYLGRANGNDAVRIPGAVFIDGSLVVGTLGGTTGNNHLCLNTANRLSGCTSNFAENSELESLRREVKELRKIVCSMNAAASVCREEK